MPDNITGGGAGGKGARLADVLVSFRRAKRRMALIEGNPVDTAAERASSSPEYIANIAAIQIFLDDPDPRVASVQADFIAPIERAVDAIDDRLNRALGTNAYHRRRHFRVISGGPHD